MDLLPQPFPILEYDPAPGAILEPSRLIKRVDDIPEHCVICFFQDVIDDLVAAGQARVIAHSSSEIGLHPVYETQFEGRPVAFFHPGIGAPLAVGLMEETIARGASKFIACGGCGVLRRDIAVGHLVVPVAAVRDEGTSYHYLPPSREAHPTPAAVGAVETTLQKYQIDYLLGKTWTTDAIYRETTRKAEQRLAEGCLTVEMEAAAFFALAHFRGVAFAQILYGGDLVLAEGWDGRAWNRHEIRSRLFWLAAEACLQL